MYLDEMCFYSEHFAMSVDDVMSGRFSERSVRRICLHRRTTTSYCRATCLLELIMLERDILHVPGIVFFY